MPRFLHTADWQIGRQFSSFDPEAAPLLAEARLACVQRLAQLANEHTVDAVLVAGDVLDAQTVSDRTLRRLFQAMQAYAGPWLLIAGNHDAALAESVWTRAQRLQCVPAHVHLLMQSKVALFEAQGFAALPAPLTQRHSFHDLTAWMDAAQTPPGLLRIGLAHGSVQGILSEAMAASNPIAPDRCTSASLDYLALGDWHGMKIIHERMAYSGTPEPDRFRNNEAGLALLVEIDAVGATPRITPLATAQYRWHSLGLDLQVEQDLERLRDMLAPLAHSDVVQLRLSGHVDWAQRAQIDALLAQTEARVRCLVVERDALHDSPTDDDLAALQADGYVGQLLVQLREQAGQGDALSQQALRLLAASLAEIEPTAKA